MGTGACAVDMNGFLKRKASLGYALAVIVHIGTGHGKIKGKRNWQGIMTNRSRKVIRMNNKKNGGYFYDIASKH